MFKLFFCFVLSCCFFTLYDRGRGELVERIHCSLKILVEI